MKDCRRINACAIGEDCAFCIHKVWARKISEQANALPPPLSLLRARPLWWGRHARVRVCCNGSPYLRNKEWGGDGIAAIAALRNAGRYVVFLLSGVKLEVAAACFVDLRVGVLEHARRGACLGKHLHFDSS